MEPPRRGGRQGGRARGRGRSHPGSRARCLLRGRAPITPGADLEARLLASTGIGRFEAFAARVSHLFDVTADRARELLGLIEHKTSWEHPVPGIHLVHLAGGPACAAADCGLVRIDPGCTFPWHRHRGEEVSVILEGSMRDRDGKVLQVGDELVHAEATEHDLVAGPEGALYVARAMNGIEVLRHRQ